MAEGNFVQPAIPRFDGHYHYWPMLMENFLRSKEYWSSYKYNWRRTHGGSTKERGGDEIESKKLSLSIH